MVIQILLLTNDYDRWRNSFRVIRLAGHRLPGVNKSTDLVFRHPEVAITVIIIFQVVFADERGIVTNSSVKSGDLRINLNQDLNKNLKLQARATAFFTETDFAESGDLIGSSNQSFVRSAIVFRPLMFIWCR